MAAELHADPRVVAAAYRTLSEEGLVELRARSGVYVRADAPHARRALDPPLESIVSLLTLASMHGYPGPRLVEALLTVVTKRPVRVVVITTTSDQGLGIARELHEDFGLDARAIVADRLQGPAESAVLRRAELLVTTQAHARRVNALAGELGAECIVMSVRSDLFENEWALWRGQPVHIVVMDSRFRKIVQGFLRASGAEAAAVRVHLATDDLSRIPDESPTYVTQAARTHLGRMRVPGMVIPPARLFAEDCVRAVWKAVGELTLARRTAR